MALYDLATHHRPSGPIPVYSEMGSINPVFILPDALQKKTKEIAEGLSQSVTLGVGQFCTNPGLVILVSPHPKNDTANSANTNNADNQGKHQRPEEVLNSFVLELSRNLASVPSGCMLTQGIRQSFEQSVKKWTELKGVHAVTTKAIPINDESHVASSVLFTTDPHTFIKHKALHQEIFGPSTLVVKCHTMEEARSVLLSLEGQLTGTIHATESDLQMPAMRSFVNQLGDRVGRLIFNGFPTGVEVNSAQNHGGPFPATTDVRSTSVGTEAIKRWLRPITFQNAPSSQLSSELLNENPRKIWRTVNDAYTNGPVVAK